MGSAGFAVRTFASAQEFLTSQRPDGPACLVLDVQLPGLSGLDLQQELAKVAVQIPIIFITGHSDIPTTFRAMKAGAIEFLTKPFRDEDLLNAVERAQRTESAKAKSDVPLEASIPDGAVPLESILRTEELYRRPSRPPDYGKENRALVALSCAMADSPRSILQTLAEKVLEVLQADSAGLSLLTKDEKRFYWAAIAGAWQPHIGGGTPRNFGPCGDVLDRNTSMLFTHWERRYPYLRPARPLAEEGLLVPFYVNGKAVGTIWAIAHTDHRKFDAEDLRLLESLGQFASAAYQVVASIDDLKSEIAAREKAEAAVLKLATGLEAKIRRLVNANIIGICIWNVDGRIIEANEAFLRIVGYDREDLLSGRVSWREVTPDKWRAADEQALAELAATGVCEPFEKEYFRKDGSRVPVLVGAALSEGSGSEGVAFVLDLSEQKRAEEALRRSEAYLAEAQRLSHTGSWHWNVRTGEVVWSQEFFAILGFDPDKTKPSYSLNLERIHPEDRPTVEQVQRAAIREKRDFEVEYRVLLPGGSMKYVQSIGQWLVSQSGDTEYIGAVMDITERKKAEEALRASERVACGQVEALVQSLDALATAPAPDQFILRMLNTMGRLLGSQWVAIWLWLLDDATDSPVLCAVVGQDNVDLDASEHPFVKDPRLWKEDSGLQELFFMGVPIPSEDVETDPRIPNALREYSRSQGTRKILRLPMLVGGKVKGFITICHAQRPPYQAAEIELAQALAHQAMLAIQTRQAATLEERNRMARDIHDTLAQGFTGIVVQLQAAEDASARGLKKDAQKHLQSARDLARESLVEARRSVHALRPQALVDTSFWDALKRMIKQITAGTAIHTTFRMRGHPRELPPLWQQNLLHIGQEALTNTLKYAHAGRFEARLSFNKKELRLELEDDGEGFTTTDRHDGLGLTGMRERVEQMGGTLRVISAPGKGTKVTVTSRYRD